jgi:hypothetical protein
MHNNTVVRQFVYPERILLQPPRIMPMLTHSCSSPLPTSPLLTSSCKTSSQFVISDGDKAREGAEERICPSGSSVADATRCCRRGARSRLLSVVGGLLRAPPVSIARESSVLTQHHQFHSNLCSSSVQLAPCNLYAHIHRLPAGTHLNGRAEPSTTSCSLSALYLIHLADARAASDYIGFNLISTTASSLPVTPT